MDIVVYKVKEGEISLCTAALVEFETLRDEVDIDDESFYISAETEEKLIKLIVKYLKKELTHQLKQNVIKNE